MLEVRKITNDINLKVVEENHLKTDIVLSKVNESTLFIDCSHEISRELYKYFSAFAPNYQFSPKYKQKDAQGNRKWNGKIYFFDIYKNYLPVGLYFKISQFAKAGGYSISSTYRNKEDIAYQDFLEFVQKLHLKDDNGNPLIAREFQLQAAYEAIKYKVLNIGSSTGSGKSVLLYMIVRWFEQYDKKIVVIVNQIQLVEQLVSDFRNYGWEEVDIKVDRVYGGTTRHSDRNITFSTWQSTFQDLTQFERFDVLICDEADTTAAKCISSITKACINASIRIGCSGSYPDEGTCEWFTIVGALGPIKTYSTYKTLQDAGQLSKMKLNLIRLVYPEKVKMKNYKENVEPYLKETKKCAETDETTVGYNKEMDLIHESIERNLFICKLISNINGNSLVLFTKKAKHGYIIRDIVTKYFPDKMIIYLDGDIDISEREDIRKLIELRNDIVLIASYGVFARGINVKNLHNIIMASNYKKKGKILQAIGRGLRLHKDKEYLNIFDLIDDMIIKIDKPKRIRYTNHSVRQFAERAKIYVAQEFDYKLSQYQIKTRIL